MIRLGPIPAHDDLEHWLESRRPPAAPVVGLYCGWLPELPERSGQPRLAYLPPAHRPTGTGVASITPAYRRIEAAYLRRIRQWSAVQLADWYHLAKTELDKDQNYANSSSVRRDVLAGGKALASFGAWPWAAYEDGVLPEHWQADAPALAALERWYEQGMDLSRRRARHERRQITRLGGLGCREDATA